MKIKQLHPKAVAPVYATPGAACFDLSALIEDDVPVTVADAEVFRTGFAFEVPEGHAMLVFSRSGHGFNLDTRSSCAPSRNTPEGICRTHPRSGQSRLLDSEIPRGRDSFSSRRTDPTGRAGGSADGPGRDSRATIASRWAGTLARTETDRKGVEPDSARRILRAAQTTAPDHAANGLHRDQMPSMAALHRLAK